MEITDKELKRILKKCQLLKHAKFTFCEFKYKISRKPFYIMPDRLF